MKTVAIALALLAVTGHGLDGQEAERNTGFLVHQLLACPSNNMEEVNRLSDLIGPIQDELVEEGMIRAWYDLRHAWGDEWNVSWVSVADSRAAWFEYWDELSSRVGERHPTVWDGLLPLCTLHKDNMYSVRDSGIGDG